MEIALKDDVVLAILTNLFRVLCLILILLKTLSFSSLKKIDLLKLNFHPRAYFLREKEKY